MAGTSFRLVAALVAFAPLLAACSSDFDPGDLTEKLDFFHLNEKKKLPGERKELFPGGVPGVTQGIPPDLVKGYQPPATAAVAVEEPPKAEPEKPKPKPHVVRRAPPKQKPAQAKPPPPPQQLQQAVQPQQAQQQPQPQQQQNGAQTPWPAPQTQSSPWPTAPAPNTFQR
jgi:hypothetical protein